MNRASRLFWMGLLLLLCTAACSPSETHLPYKAWRLGFFAPQNMEVWIEDAHVEDVNGNMFFGYSPGGSAMGYNPDSAAWPNYIGLGGGKYVTGAALPKYIYVRWQSLVEPQTYRVLLKVPEQFRQQMLLQAPSMMRVPDNPHDPEYYMNVTIGLAPGGIVRVWATGPGLQAIPIMCVKAQIEPKGPSQGLTGGTYAYSRDQLDSRAQAYLKTHPIPYGIWGC